MFSLYTSVSFRGSLTGLCLCMLFTMPATASSVPATEQSVARGAELFDQYCTECHGWDGRALVDVISDATDLTDPQAYYNGTSEDDMFFSIANGAGEAMPAFNSQLQSDDLIWDLVNFIRSLWSESDRSYWSEGDAQPLESEL